MTKAKKTKGKKTKKNPRGRPRNVPFKPDPGREPWERQPRESDKAFAAFVVFRDYGPTRALMRAVERLEKGRRYYSTVARWSAQYGWAMRASAWDDEQDRVAREAKLDAIRAMNDRHGKIAMGMLALVGTELKKFIDDSRAKAKKKTLSATEIKKLADLATRLDRAVHGEPEQVIEARGQMTWLDVMRKATERKD